MNHNYSNGRVCEDCGKPIINKARGTRCKPCRYQYELPDMVKHDPVRKEQHKADGELRRKYGLTLEQYYVLFDSQGGKCWLCDCYEPLRVNGRPKRLAVDHDHTCCPGDKSCGSCIRGLLCSDCNTALGKLKDSPALLRKAADYIESSRIDGATVR